MGHQSPVAQHPDATDKHHPTPPHPPPVKAHGVSDVRNPSTAKQDLPRRKQDESSHAHLLRVRDTLEAKQSVEHRSSTKSKRTKSSPKLPQHIDLRLLPEDLELYIIKMREISVRFGIGVQSRRFGACENIVFITDCRPRREYCRMDLQCIETNEYTHNLNGDTKFSSFQNSRSHQAPNIIAHSRRRHS